MSTIFPPIDEGTTPIYTTTLKDEAGLAITGLPFTGARVSYYNMATGADINNRNNQNILNANNVTIDTNGLLTWKLQEADVITTDSGTMPPIVQYRAEFVVEWNDISSTPRQKTHVIEIPITRLVKRPFTP